MSTVPEIEAAIQKLSPKELEELFGWIQGLQTGAKTLPAFDEWLATARGAATTNLTTDQIISMTRGEE